MILMAVCKAFFVLLIFTFVSVLQAGATEYKPNSGGVQATVVQAYVFCQNCYKEWDRHLPGAEVVVECRAKASGKIVAHSKGFTNKDGYVEIKLEKYDFKANYNVDVCLAKIVRSRDPGCDYRTNVNFGYSGAKPQFSKVSAGVAYFTTNGFSFTPMCYL